MKPPSPDGVQFRRLGLVVLVLDVADDRLDHVLDRNEPVGAAVFVDHQRHMGARRLHAEQEIERGHRRRARREPAAGFAPPTEACRARLAVAVGGAARRAFDQAEARIGGEEDRRNRGCGSCRADRRACRRRPAGASGRRSRKQVEHLAQGRVERKRDDVGARHHHVGDPDVVQREHVLEDRALLRA